MSQHNAAVFACRILAILALLLSVRSVLNFIGMIPLLVEAMRPAFSWEALQPYLGGSLGDSLGGIVLLNFAVLFWFFAPLVAKWITRGMQDETLEETSQVAGWYTMAVALVGFLLMGTVDMGIASFAFQIFMGGVGNWYWAMAIVGWFFHVMLGLILVFRCRAIARWILRT